MAEVIVERGRHQGLCFRYPPPPFFGIGQHEGCHIRLLDEQAVGPTHAFIEVRDAGKETILVHVCPGFKTFVAGRLVSREEVLHHGDLIEFGEPGKGPCLRMVHPPHDGQASPRIVAKLRREYWTNKAHDDRIWLDRHFQGDPYALPFLIKAYEVYIYRIGLCIFEDRHEDARAFCHSIFTKAIKQIGQLRTFGSFGPWFIRLAIREIDNYKMKCPRTGRKRQARPASISQVSRLPCDGVPLPEEIAGLPLHVQLVLMLDSLAFGYKEIGFVLDITENTVGTYLHRQSIKILGIGSA